MAQSVFPSKPNVPSGNTASRPSSPVTGDTYYNGTIGILEIYTGSSWIPCSAPPSMPSISVTNVGTDVPYGAAQASVAFTAGSVGGKVTGYTATATTGGYFNTGTSSPVVVTVGVNGSYSFTGTSYNDYGTSVSTASSTATLTTVPQAPTIGSAAGGNGEASVIFTGNNTGGSAITSYTATSSPGNITATSSTSPITVTGLTNATAYTFTVKANNANGASAASAASNSVTPIATVPIDYLVIAGGAGPSNAGGGAGGLRSTMNNTGRGGSLESQFTATRSTNYTVTVGAGGANTGANGSNSVFNTITSLGGGTDQTAGGSGGGGSVSSSNLAGAGTTGQGYDGGRGGIGSGQGTGGGGGGAGVVGGQGNIGTGGTGGAGGNGVSVSITGTAVTYAGGGGAGGNYQYQTNQGGAGGTGGGGNGACFGGGAVNGVSGTTNLGGGGGGAGYLSGGRPAGAGGSGVVILRYPNTATITIGAGLTGTTATDGSSKVTTITAGSGNVSWA